MAPKTSQLAPEKWRDWPDWARVLVYWKHECHKHGLTMQALGEICQRSPATMWKEMQEYTNGIGGGFCFIIHAPIVTIRYEEEWDPCRDFRCLTLAKAKWKDEYSQENKNDVKKEVTKLLKKFPWPKYKGLASYDGLANFTPLAKLEDLQEAAAGKVCPWGKRWERHWRSE